MNYPLLSPFRQVIFNPCVPSGDRLTTEAGNVCGELLGLAHGNPKGEGIKLIRHSTMGEAYAMLEAVGARFDIIVSAPPAGTIPSKGLPKPPRAPDAMAKPAGRKLFVTTDAPAPVPEIDLGYATWLVTNALLSPFGEAMLFVTDASWELIQKDPNANRIWHRQEYAPEKNDPRTQMLYLARDHRQPYGQPVVPHEIIGDEGMFRSKRIKGITLNHATCGQVDSIKKFMTVRDEISRKQLNAGGDDWNVLLDDGKFRVKFSPYAIDTGAIPRDLVTKVEGLLRGKTPLDLAVMRDTRDQTTAILKDKRLKIPPAVVAAFADVCKQMAILSAPFTRPSPVQRVAWLDEQNTIECIRDWGCFRAGEHYDVATQTITGRKTEKRHRPGFGTEDVLVTGQEVLIRLYANHQKGGDGFWHAFTQFPITKEMPEWTTYTHNGAAHTLSDLIINFAMPEVLDIAEADPASFEKYHKRLQALQSA